MDSPALGLYVAASLALIATPGQDMMYVISRSLAQGRVAGLASAAGVSLGILVHTALAALGVGALLRASPALFLALRLGGAAYLAWLGLRMLLVPPREGLPGRSAELVTVRGRVMVDRGRALAARRSPHRSRRSCGRGCSPT